MASEEFYRQAARRSHRTLGSYLVQWAWMKGVDCVILKRADYQHFVGLDTKNGRVPRKRVDWLKSDLESVFPYASSLSVKSGKWSAIALSRREFPEDAFKVRMSHEQRIARLKNDGILAAVVDLASQRSVVEAMARIAAGLEDFSLAPWA